MTIDHKKNMAAILHFLNRDEKQINEFAAQMKLHAPWIFCYDSTEALKRGNDRLFDELSEEIVVRHEKKGEFTFVDLNPNCSHLECGQMTVGEAIDPYHYVVVFADCEDEDEWRERNEDFVKGNEQLFLFGDHIVKTSGESMERFVLRLRDSAGWLLLGRKVLQKPEDPRP